MNSRRIGVFDLGSNSIKYLAAEVSGTDVLVLKSSYAVTRLGEGTGASGVLLDEAMSRTIEVIQTAKSDFETLGVTEWIAVATSAVRDSKNGADFRQRLKKQAGLDLQILSGMEEAELIYHGVVSDKTFVKPDDRLVVVDSGGGSTEFILGTAANLEKRVSLNLGCVRMTEQFLEGDPYNPASLDRMNLFYRDELSKLKTTFDFQNRKFIFTGGTISTTAKILCQFAKKDSKDLHGFVITRQDAQDCMHQLACMRNEERIEKLGLEPRRADVLTAGLAIFTTAMDVLDIPQGVISLRGLRFGLLSQLLKQSN